MINMTEEQEIEEILMESHSYGLRVEVIEAASKIMGSTPKIRRIDAYHKAFDSIIVE
jgi:predicted nucleic acid-binding Zn finger protein